MKKLFALLLSASMLTASSCDSAPIETPGDYGNLISDEEAPRPEQDVMFVIISTNYAWEYDCDGAIIDTDGNFYYIPQPSENESLTDSIEKAKATEVIRTVPDEDLQVMYRFIDMFDANDDYDMDSYGHFMDDYGSKDLGIIYYNENGEAEYRVLFSYGDNAYCIKSEMTRNFANWMADKGYFYMDELRFDYEKRYK